MKWIITQLFVIGGLSHDEIAGKLDISSRTSKGRRQLQKILFNRNNISIEFTT
jgi:DNA-directed RNA polymerase specialized sigma24 family protein